MFRTRLRKSTLGLVVSVVLSFITAIPPNQLLITVAGTLVLQTQMSCGADDLRKLHDTLNKTAKSMEAAIDTNGRLYQNGIYGVTGSPPAIALRQKVAKAIHDSNEYLIQALNLAKGLTKDTFESGKLGVLEKLTLAAAGLQVGNPTIDLVLQSVSALINQAVAIVQLFQSNEANHLWWAVPRINEHLKAFGHIQEVSA